MPDGSGRNQRGLFELYESDPEAADRRLFGRVPYPDRRGFLRGAGLAALTAAVGAAVPFHRFMPSGFIPLALAETGALAGKDGLMVFNDRPVNAETPAHLLDDRVTPAARHFVRNNGVLPESLSPDGWMVAIDGEVDSPLELSIEDLKSRFEVVTAQLTVECAGNGRAFFDPPASGNQWTYGAIGCSEWTGVRLADVLKAAGVKSSAIYTGHYGADTHLSGDPGKLPISRGVPIEKAMDPNNLIAFAMNGQEIHPLNGAPLRLVIPGFPGSCSQKWLTRIQLRDIVHDGPKMTGTSYRVPRHAVAPGTEVPEEDFVIVEEMPVKSLITSPESGTASGEQALEVRGHAWAGGDRIAAVHVTNDFGATWVEAEVEDPANPYAWQHWKTQVSFPEAGYYEVWARATTDKGVSQPFAVAWNPKGYVNNAMHRIALQIG